MLCGDLFPLTKKTRLFSFPDTLFPGDRMFNFEVIEDDMFFILIVLSRTE